MSFIKFCKRVYLLHFSKTPENRPIYQAVLDRKPTRIVQLGIGTGQRTLEMLRLAAGQSPDGGVYYTGVDLFEMRTEADGPGLRLKDAHQTLQVPGVKVQLVPGDPFSALARLANSLPNIDLMLISKCQDRQSLEKAWFYVPRMLYDGSLILQENADGTDFQEVKREDLARYASTRRAA